MSWLSKGPKQIVSIEEIKKHTIDPLLNNPGMTIGSEKTHKIIKNRSEEKKEKYYS